MNGAFDKLGESLREYKLKTVKPPRLVKMNWRSWESLRSMEANCYNEVWGIPISIDPFQANDVFVFEDVINAAGNDILVNDNGALIHPDIKERSVKKIGETLGVPVLKGTIASLKTVGMAAVVTNKGCLCHPKISDDEKKQLEELFDVEERFHWADISSVDFAKEYLRLRTQLQVITITNQ